MAAFMPRFISGSCPTSSSLPGIAGIGGSGSAGPEKCGAGSTARLSSSGFGRSGDQLPYPPPSSTPCAAATPGSASVTRHAASPHLTVIWWIVTRLRDGCAAGRLAPDAPAGPRPCSSPAPPPPGGVTRGGRVAASPTEIEHTEPRGTDGPSTDL